MEDFLIYGVYGLGFFAYGVICLSCALIASRIDQQIRLCSLGVFGVAHGVYEWAAYAGTLTGADTLHVGFFCIGAVSFFALYSYALSIFTRNVVVTLSVPVGLFVLWSIFEVQNPSPAVHDFALRWVVGIPALIIAGTGLMMHRRAIPTGKTYPLAHAAGMCLYIYAFLQFLSAPGEFFPVSFFNTPAFVQATDAPLLIIRGIVAIALAIISALQIRAFHIETVEKAADFAQKLHRSETTLFAILKSSPEAILVTDSKGIITIFSAGAEATFGFSSEDVLGKSIDALIPERFRREHVYHMRDFAVGGSASKTMGERSEILAMRDTGEEFPALASISKLDTPDGMIFAVILRDITARKIHETNLEDAKKRAEAASDAKSAFLASMSHELRTPLNGVIGSAQVLENANKDDETLKWVKMIRNSGESLLQLLNDILDLTKIESGVVSVAENELELDEIYHSIIEPRRILVEEKGVDLQLNTAFDDTIYVGDEKRIKQVVTNLLNNAIKFTMTGSITVSASTECCDGRMILKCSVADTGPGIPEDKLEAVFERFIQVDNSLNRSYNGAGLGLAICKELCEALGGGISVQSEDGAGSVFSFWLPIKELAQTAPSAIADNNHINTADRNPNSLNARCLIVDDQPLNRQIFSALIKPFTNDAMVAEDGASALAMFAEHEFDFVFLDIHMPTLNGIETLKRMRALNDRPLGTRFVAVTADAMLGDKEKYIGCGFDDYISKPVKLSEIKRVLSADNQQSSQSDSELARAVAI